MSNGGYNALVRQKLMETIWNKMDETERVAFIIVSIESSNHHETMQAITDLSQKIDENKHSWLSDFGANIAGNAAYSAGLWLMTRMFRKLL